jgi:glycosyltransferase involved in cell wall biosynthesis
MSSVDVIVPCYRYGHFLRESVESVLTQSLKNVRVLILDDASPDNTSEVGAELAREDSRVTLVRHPVNKGHIATYNEGIDWVSADYMLLLSADDFLLPGALERAATLLDAHPEVGFVFGRAIELDASGTRTYTSPIVAGNARKSPARILTGMQFIELSGPRNIVPTPTAIVRTALQKQVGGYCVELPHSGDMEMWLRLAANASVGVLEAPQAVYRRHADNMSHAYLTKDRIPDLEQRKAALDQFAQYSGNVLKNGDQAHRKLLSLLSRDATGYASAAFNGGDMDACSRLSALALEICPGVEKSMPWIKLACKRWMGLDRWLTVQSFVAGWRRHALSMSAKAD